MIAAEKETPPGMAGCLELSEADFVDNYRVVRQFAKAYAALGWRTFPLKPGSKVPATAHGFRDATLDPAEVEKWPDNANLGIATGEKIWVLDVDGPEGRASLEMLEAQHGELPQTLTQITRNGGRHYVFQAAPGVRTRAGLLPGIDTRAAGGYIAAEPSRVDADDPAGSGKYLWEDWEPPTGEIPEIAPAPDWLLTLARGDQQTAPAAPAPRSGIAQGSRNDFLSKRAYALRKAGAEAAEILTALRRINSSECQPPLDEAELVAIARGKSGIQPDQIEPTEPTEPPLKLVDLSATDNPEPAFWIENILPAGAVTLLGAHGGSGKSTLSLGLAAHLATGRPWAGLGVKKAKVGFVSLEDGADIVRSRLRRTCEAFNLSLGEVAQNLLIFDGTASAMPLVEETNDRGVKTIQPTAAFHQLHSMPVDIWVVDGASDAFDANEIDRRQVRAFVRKYLTGLVHNTGGAVLLLAHINKDTARMGGKESYSGSTAWHNSARSRLALSSDGGDLVKLEHQKSNYGKLIEPLTFAWDERGVLIPSAKPQNAPQCGAILHLDGAVLDAIEKAAASGVHVPTATGGARNAAGVITEMLPSGATTRTAINAALIRLEQRSLIRRVEIVTSARHRREVWATAPNAPNAPNEDSEHLAQSAAPNAPIVAGECEGGTCAHSAQEIGADQAVEVQL